MTGIPTACTRCAAPLVAENITGECRECKHILRAARVGYTAPEVPLAEARANFMRVFGGLYRTQSADGLFMRGACRRCGRFRARHDSGCCSWCHSHRRRKQPTRREHV